MIPVSLVLSLTWSKTLSDRFVWYRNAVNLFSLSLGSSLPSSSGAHGVPKGTFCTWEWKLQLYLHNLIMENNFSTEIHVQIPLLSPQNKPVFHTSTVQRCSPGSHHLVHALTLASVLISLITAVFEISLSSILNECADIFLLVRQKHIWSVWLVFTRVLKNRNLTWTRLSH